VARDHSKDIQLHRAILAELGYNLTENSTVLDFGCGEGRTVFQYRSAGFNAFGVDTKLEDETEFIRLIPTKEIYKIPFDNDFFDFVISEQVFEHVQNLPAVLSEIYRILKPGGFSLNIFPPKYSLIERHTFIPLAGTLQRYPWLLLWAFLGVRNSYQKGLPFTKVAARNYDYLQNKTLYLSKKEISDAIQLHFKTVKFAEKWFIKHSYGRSRMIYPLAKLLPFIPPLFSFAHQRVIFFRKGY
jgi:SAM-dependent methyltransferase